jgi:monovalent cation:H+ antiporter-2, CPA2 family
MQSVFLELLFLLAITVLVVAAFQFKRIPSSLGYLFVGVALGPHALGLIANAASIRIFAEFGIVFLLFTIGLSFSLPQIYALRHLVFGLGTGQVLLTTTAVTLIGWSLGLPFVAAFVVGAVFAQSSTTIIAKQLDEQDEGGTRHGRFAVAMSVFQDVTAVPFVVVIPVLGAAGVAAADPLAATLSWALAKALLAFAVVYLAGRWLLRPMFHVIAQRRSPELFTLTVLLVALAAAAATDGLGLSLAFGAFLAGMMMGETEFRHQIESTIRPFRDVLLGLFFISIGMLFDPTALPRIWHLALAAAAGFLLLKVVLVTGLVRWGGADWATAWKTALVLAVGGEFGFALLAIAVDAQSIDNELAQIALTAVLLSMIAGPILIRNNSRLARILGGASAAAPPGAPAPSVPATSTLVNHVIICGYGRIGQNVGHFLEEESIPFVALDLDPARVREAHAAGEPVFYGDAADSEVLEAVGLERARLLVVSHDDVGASLKVLQRVRAARPQLPVMIRTRDESRVDELMKAGATEVVPETLEAGMMIVSHALLLLGVPLAHVLRRIRDERMQRYRLMREFYRSSDVAADDEDAARLHALALPDGAHAVGRSLADLDLHGANVVATALLREGKRILAPPPEILLQANDVVVLFGTPADLDRAERRLLG